MAEYPPSMVQLLQTGVVDLRLPAITVLGSQNERAMGAGATAIQSMIGPYMVDRFESALSCLVVSTKPSMTREAIDVRYVLAQPWRLARLAKCIGYRSDGPFRDPIDVNRIRFPGLPDLFQVLNGCHRTFAARRNGDTLIEAYVHSVLVCDPDAYFVSGQTLLRGHGQDAEPVSPTNPSGPAVREDQATVGPDIVTILNGLGCRGAADPHSRAATTVSFLE